MTFPFGLHAFDLHHCQTARPNGIIKHPDGPDENSLPQMVEVDITIDLTQ
jgi:hypothetical protein